MLISPINVNFGSRVDISRKIPKTTKRILKENMNLNEIAQAKDVYIKLSPSKESVQKSLVQIYRKGTDHVSDIPRYAVAHDTGDQVYITWQNKIFEKEVNSNENELSAAIMQGVAMLD